MPSHEDNSQLQEDDAVAASTEATVLGQTDTVHIHESPLYDGQPPAEQASSHHPRPPSPPAQQLPPGHARARRDLFGEGLPPREQYVQSPRNFIMPGSICPYVYHLYERAKKSPLTDTKRLSPNT